MASKKKMAKTDILTDLPCPVFTGSPPVATKRAFIVGPSSAGHNNSPLLSSQSPNAREMLLQVQRGGGATSKPSKPLSLSQDKALRQKGIILTRQLSRDTTDSSSLLRRSPRQPMTATNTAATPPSQLPFNDRIPTLKSPLYENGPVGSPDSGYDDLTTAARNRSSTAETSSSDRNRSSTADTNTSVESSSRSNSHLTCHDSVLELVKEEEGEEGGEREEGEAGETSKSRCTSNASNMTNSDRSDSTTSSFPFPLSTFSDQVKLEDSFYHPDDQTILQVAHRRGIQRSSSTEESCDRRVSMDEGNKSRRKSGGGTGEGKRGRSASLFVKEGANRSSLDLDFKDTFQLQDQLSKENYHFMLSDALLSVVEEYKSLLKEQEYDEHLTSHSITSTDSSTSPDIVLASCSSSLLPPPSYLSSPSPAGSNSSCTNLESMEDDTLSSDRIDSDSPPVLYPTPPTPTTTTTATHHHTDVSLLRLVNSTSMTNTAESTAHGLLQYVAKVLGGASSIEFRAPQVVQLPSDFISCLKREEQLHYSVNANSTPIRGGIDWAPPRKTIIHTVHTPANARDLPTALSLQGKRCAGCGMIMDTSQSKFFRFCYYVGKYFCISCHQNSLSSIPAYIIFKWHFKRLPVSNFARDTLAEIEKEPHFNLDSLYPTLYHQESEMKKMKDCRIQLNHMWKYLKTCRASNNLFDQFIQLGHLVSTIHLYSIDDFQLIKSGFLLKHLRLVVRDTEKHIKNCVFCKDKGYVCEYCNNYSDILYPFELDKISSCPKCSSCFHKNCYSVASSDKKECPKCRRLKERQQRRIKTMLIADEDDV